MKIKNTLGYLAAVIFMISVGIIFLGIVVGIGYTIYLIPSNSIGFALWQGFLTWLYFVIMGIIGTIISVGIADISVSIRKKR